MPLLIIPASASSSDAETFSDLAERSDFVPEVFDFSAEAWVDPVLPAAAIFVLADVPGSCPDAFCLGVLSFGFAA